MTPGEKVIKLVEAAKALCEACKDLDRYPYGEVCEVEEALENLGVKL